MTPLQETALRMCAHKTKYPLFSTAQKKAEQSSKSSGERIEPYKCSLCGSWHIGHPKEYDVNAKPIEELHLAKIRDPFGNYWIFAVASEEDLLKSTQEIYSAEGTLVAYKKGKDPFKERGGSRSKHWRAFNAIYPIFITDSDYGFMEILEAKKEDMGVIGVKPEDLPGAGIEEDLVALVLEQGPGPFVTDRLNSDASQVPQADPEEVSKLSLEEILKRFEEMSAPDSGLSGDYVKGFVHGVLAGRR